MDSIFSMAFYIKQEELYNKIKEIYKIGVKNKKAGQAMARFVEILMVLNK